MVSIVQHLDYVNKRFPGSCKVLLWWESKASGLLVHCPGGVAAQSKRFTKVTLLYSTETAEECSDMGFGKIKSTWHWASALMEGLLSSMGLLAQILKAGSGPCFMWKWSQDDALNHLNWETFKFTLLIYLFWSRDAMRALWLPRRMPWLPGYHVLRVITLSPLTGERQESHLLWIINYWWE